MAILRVTAKLDAPREVVWDDLRHLSRHVEWMEDAAKIDFVTDQTEGLGTAFDCLTVVGPFRLTDRMEITEWEPPRRMGVRHVGLVTGEGTFRLVRRRKGRCMLIWQERLNFPWWMAGPLGAWGSVPVLTLVWRRSMRNLEARYRNGELVRPTGSN